MSKTGMNKKEFVLDIVKEVLLWAVVTALAFAWWMLVLLLMSLFLLNVWHTSFEAILRYGIICTVITSVIYAANRIYRGITG